MMSGMPYPVSMTIEPQLVDRDRVTTAFRLILAIPHLILVGGVGLGFAANSGRRDFLSLGGETGLLGSVAFLLAIISWFTLLISIEHYTPIRRYTRYYLRWRVRALAYLMLLTDEYPPFGDAPFPAALAVADPAAPRDRVTIGFRLLLAIPHFLALFLVSCVWWVTTVVAWFFIVIDGRYPQGLYDFSVGALRWLIRGEAYILLLVEGYPPFSLV